MFGWFLRFLRLRPVEFRRDIFTYTDGGRKRSADPVEIERALTVILGEDWRDKLASLGKPLAPGVLGEDAVNMRKDREKLRSEILYAIDCAFDVKAYKDGEGMTEAERLGLVAGFNQYCISLIARSRNFRNVRSRESPTRDR